MYIYDKDRIVKICVKFYEELYRSRRALANQDSHGDPTILPLPLTHHPYYSSEVEASLKRLKRNKALGDDNITGGILQRWRRGYKIKVLTDLFRTCLHHRQVPKAWKNALIVLRHNK